MTLDAIAGGVAGAVLVQLARWVFLEVRWHWHDRQASDRARAILTDNHHRLAELAESGDPVAIAYLDAVSGKTRESLTGKGKPTTQPEVDNDATNG